MGGFTPDACPSPRRHLSRAFHATVHDRPLGKTGLTYEGLETAFRHRNLRPLYFLYGEERFLMDELQALLIEHALAPGERDFNFDLIYGAEAEASAVLALCNAYPMMAERRVVVVRDFEKLKGNRLFTTYAERPSPHAVVLLLCGSKPNLSAHPYRALRQHAAWGEFKRLYDNQMAGWVAARAERLGHRLEPQAASMLAEFVGTDLQAAAAEIDKLITHAGGRATLTADDVLRASGQTREFNVFELQRAVGEGRYPDAVRISERLLQQASSARGEALMIVSVLASYVTKLWKLSAPSARQGGDRAAASRIGVSPFFVKEYLRAAQRFSPTALAEAFAALLAADFELKGGAHRDERLVLTLLLRRLVPAAHPAGARR